MLQNRFIKLYFILLFFISIAGCKPYTPATTTGHMRTQQTSTGNRKWKLIWADDFSNNRLDTSKWTIIPRGKSAWEKHMSADSQCYSFKDGYLYLRGINNPDTSIDKSPFLTGGIYTKGKFAFQYGKIEIRAKLECAQGAWPAMWMLAAQNKYGEYPKNGEIDIMEHLNFDSSVYQTIHSYYTLTLKQENKPPHYSTAKMNPGEFNTFGLEWYQDKIVFTVNGQSTFTYPKVNNVDPSQWPFDQPFYLLIDQQLGGSWVGNVNSHQLPVQMIVDWVKVYQ